MGRQVEMKMFVKPISLLKYEQKGLGPLPRMLEWRSSSNFIPHATENNHLPIWLSVGIPFWGVLVTSWDRHLKVWGAVGHQRNMLDLYNQPLALDRSANGHKQGEGGVCHLYWKERYHYLASLLDHQHKHNGLYTETNSNFGLDMSVNFNHKHPARKLVGSSWQLARWLVVSGPIENALFFFSLSKVNGKSAN